MCMSFTAVRAQRTRIEDVPAMDRFIFDPSNPAKPIPEEDIRVWGWWMANANRQVAATTVDGARVSTVFLGVNHGFFGRGEPVLWETMVFGGDFDGEQRRYTSYAAAKRGHRAVVALVRRGRR